MAPTMIPTDLRQMARDLSIEARVPSFTQDGVSYIVRWATTPLPYCECADHQYRGHEKGHVCKHAKAVRRAIDGMSKLYQQLSGEIREESGSRGRHPTARGGQTLKDAADVLADAFGADPVS